MMPLASDALSPPPAFPCAPVFSMILSAMASRHSRFLSSGTTASFLLFSPIIARVGELMIPPFAYHLTPSFGTCGGSRLNFPIISKCGSFIDGSFHSKLKKFFMASIADLTAFFAAFIFVEMLSFILLNRPETNSDISCPRFFAVSTEFLMDSPIRVKKPFTVSAMILNLSPALAMSSTIALNISLNPSTISPMPDQHFSQSPEKIPVIKSIRPPSMSSTPPIASAIAPNASSSVSPITFTIGASIGMSVECIHSANGTTTFCQRTDMHSASFPNSSTPLSIIGCTCSCHTSLNLSASPSSTGATYWL